MSLEMLEILIYVFGTIGIVVGIIGVLLAPFAIYQIWTDTDSYYEVDE